MEDFTTNGSSSAVEQRQIWPWQQHAILSNIGFFKKNFSTITMQPQENPTEGFLLKNLYCLELVCS